MANYWFDHVHLGSDDAAKAAEFYERVIGAKQVGTINLPGGRTLFQLDLKGSRIAISPPNPRPINPGGSEARYVQETFALRTDNIEEAVAELKAEGIKFLQDITVTSPQVKLAFFLGPNDVLIELLEKSG